jgi:type II secretory pathway component PulF
MLFLQTLSVLLSGGVHLAQALNPAVAAISNKAMRYRFSHIEHEVLAGKNLSEVLAIMEKSRSPELYGLIAIGEASGTLARMVHQAALLYQERLYHYLNLITTVIQPIFLIIMGLLVSLLIMVIYTPLLTLSHALF